MVAPKDSARGAERPPTVSQCRKVVQAARHGKGRRPTLETTKLRNAYEREGIKAYLLITLSNAGQHTVRNAAIDAKGRERGKTHRPSNPTVKKCSW